MIWNLDDKARCPYLFHKSDKHLLSGLTRERTLTNGEPIGITADSVEVLFRQAPRTIVDRGNKILSYVSRASTFFGVAVPLNTETDYPIGFCKNSNEFDSILACLKERNLLQLDRLENRILATIGAGPLRVTAK